MMKSKEQKLIDKEQELTEDFITSTNDFKKKVRNIIIFLSALALGYIFLNTLLKKEHSELSQTEKDFLQNNPINDFFSKLSDEIIKIIKDFLKELLLKKSNQVDDNNL